MDTKYLRFVLREMGEKTSITAVESKSRGSLLGIIKWYGPWRQYCFYPCFDTVFNNTCLNDISRFMENLMKNRNGK